MRTGSGKPYRQAARMALVLALAAQGCGGTSASTGSCRPQGTACATTADCCVPGICQGNTCVTLDDGGVVRADAGTAGLSVRGGTSGLGGGRSTGGPYVLSGSLGLPQVRVPSSGGAFTVQPLVPGHSK